MALCVEPLRTNQEGFYRFVGLRLSFVRFYLILILLLDSGSYRVLLLILVRNKIKYAESANQLYFQLQ